VGASLPFQGIIGAIVGELWHFWGGLGQIGAILRGRGPETNLEIIYSFWLKMC
jgi:hypothetical protein